MSRPASVAEILSATAHYLDLTDTVLEKITALAGEPLEQGKSVQADLLMIAAWMREHPEIDAQIHTLLTALPE